jgi:hypothetical protein
MKRLHYRLIWGALLVGVGLLLLLQNFNILGFLWGGVWAFLFAAGGAAFLVVFLSHRNNWWAAIPGFTLLGIGALIGLGTFFPRLENAVGGSLFLGAIGLSFWVVYLRSREQWWAIIPGGVLLTLATVAGLSNTLPWVETGGMFFLGLAATFGLVYLLPTPQGRMSWAIIPAAVLFVIGLIVTVATSSLFRYIWPAALILVGLWLIYRVFRPR